MYEVTKTFFYLPLMILRWLKTIERNRFVRSYKPSTENQRRRSQTYRNTLRRLSYEAKKTITPRR